MKHDRIAVVSTLALAMASLAGCASTAPRVAPTLDPGLVELGSHMTGSFSSREQASRDPDFREVRLAMVRLWPERPDAVWLYVEQAMATSLDKPYRQRVYRLTHLGGDLYESRVFEPPDSERLAGACEDPGKLALIAEDELAERRGCEILLRRSADGTFSGSTLGRLCISVHRGATYATSEVTVSVARLVSWDRGFDAAGSQVWGAEKGGYEFVKLEGPVAR